MPSQRTLKRIEDRLRELQLKKAAPLLILDVGGGVNPFAAATHVIDQCAYQDYMRFYYNTGKYSKTGIIGGSEIKVTPENWIVRDITKHEAWPFPDKYFDFCFCSGTLEDVMDPFVVMSEMSRVAKEGFIGTPTKEFECTRGIEGRWRGRHYTGYSHHRWLFSSQADRLLIERKWHCIHGSNRWSFPPRFKKKWLKSDMKSMAHFWQDTILIEEIQYRDYEDLDQKQEAMILQYRPLNPTSFLYRLVMRPLLSLWHKACSPDKE
jgi:hypothetical protein